MNRVKIFFFATLRDRVGQKELILELPDQLQVKELKKILVELFPYLNSSMESVLVSINLDYAFDEDFIPENAEIALFPPVSGGKEMHPTVLTITEEKLDLEELLGKITLPTTGAACLFIGMVREVTERTPPHETVYLEYDSYQPMAEIKLRQIADEIREKWPGIEGIAIVQRIGHLLPATPTVLIACSSAHRDTGVFEAARYGIDRLKEIVPIWKKEVNPSGEFWVEGGYIPSPNDKVL